MLKSVSEAELETLERLVTEPELGREGPLSLEERVRREGMEVAEVPSQQTLQVPSLWSDSSEDTSGSRDLWIAKGWEEL